MTLEEALKLSYAIYFYNEDEGGYTVEIRELPGCVAQGETLEESLEMLDEAQRLWIETAYEHGDEIPLPSSF